jgi:hypothetical protein
MMAEAYDGRQVVGMDLHRRRNVLVQMTEDGRKLETVRITNSPAALRREIAKAGNPQPPDRSGAIAPRASGSWSGTGPGNSPRCLTQSWPTLVSRP